MRRVIGLDDGAAYAACIGGVPMCLGVPGEIVEVKDRIAVVDFWGTKRPVRLDQLTQPVKSGDYVIDHAGYAVRVIPPADVFDTLALYEVLLTEAGEDPIAGDINAELEGCAVIEIERDEVLV